MIGGGSRWLGVGLTLPERVVQVDGVEPPADFDPRVTTDGDTRVTVAGDVRVVDEP